LLSKKLNFAASRQHHRHAHDVSTTVENLALTSPACEAADTVTERGVLLECTGQRAGLAAYVNLDENDVHTNYVQVVLNDRPRLAASREPSDILAAGEVRTSVRIAELKAKVSGTAQMVGRRTHVDEEIDDAGQHVVSDGLHRRLATDLVLRYDGTTVPLSCAPAFAYKLDVTRTDLTG